MTALAASRGKTVTVLNTVTLPGKTEQVYKGGIACWDTSTGLVAKAFVSVNLVPIGYYVQDQLTAASGTVTIELFHEVRGVWFTNATAGDAVVAATLGGLVYLLDDQTVAQNDATNTRSVFGRCWKIDPNMGVFVEPHTTAGDRLGGLDA